MQNNLRLTTFEIDSIRDSFLAIKSQKKIDGRLYLFGSRVSAKKRGGDIDLLWLLSKSEVERARVLKFDLIAKIKLLLDEQKIDVTVIADEDASADAFYQSIKQALIQIE